MCSIQLAREINCVQGPACSHAWTFAQTGAGTGVQTGRTGARTPFCIELLFKKKISFFGKFTFGALLRTTIGERYFGLLFAHAIWALRQGCRRIEGRPARRGSRGQRGAGQRSGEGAEGRGEKANAIEAHCWGTWLV